MVMGKRNSTSGQGSGGDPDESKRRGVHIRVGEHLDLTIGVYISPQALVLASSLGAGAGFGAWFSFMNR